MALAVGAIIWIFSEHQHRASTYGITDPSIGALRISNSTSDFAISYLYIEQDEMHQVFRDSGIEIEPGGETVLEVDPGTYLVRVHYVEIAMVVAFRPQGTLSEYIVVSPGKAVLLDLQGGRSSPEGSIFIPPVLVEE